MTSPSRPRSGASEGAGSPSRAISLSRARRRDLAGRLGLDLRGAAAHGLARGEGRIEPVVEHAFRRGVPRHDPVRRALQAVLRDGNHDPEILAMQPRARREELAAHAGRGQHVDAVGRAARLAGDRAREAVAPLGQLRVLLQCHVAHGPVAARTDSMAWPSPSRPRNPRARRRRASGSPERRNPAASSR